MSSLRARHAPQAIPHLQHVASSFNGRTVGSEPINRGSNPWEATNICVGP